MTSKQNEQAERRSVLSNAVQVRKQESEASTFFQQAKLSEQLDGSRLKSSVTGAKPYDVPPIPSGPWSSGWCPPMPEEPLGYSVEEVPICGAPHEIEASIARLEQAESSPQPEALTPEHFPSEVIRDGVGAKPLRIRRMGK